MDTPSNIARFKRERNILANLDHPNIARLLDGGVTQDGLPYLVMEYIKGIPLLEYCNTHQLSIEKRLELFTSVCKAVKHAHRNATIHRDLKPSNILVTDDGTVKVLDFGIAKLMMDSTADSTFQTRTGARMMTLGYAAPEQYQNNAVTTATDIYTLGILMYELLTGSSPFDIESKNLANLEKHVLGGGPAKPADKFAKLPESQKTKIASQRGTTPSFMTQKIRGDLGAIIMKALRREPKARYRSVEQMLEDLNRYEHAQPLIAQSDTLKYRVGKFLKRNRKAVVGACLILAAIIGFGSYHIDQITEERNIAEAEAQKAETVKNFLVDIFRSSNPQSTSYEGKNVTARELMLNGQNRITGKLKDQPDVYIEVLTAIGDALTGIDAFAEAEESYRKALSQTPQIADSLESKVRIYVKLGQLESKRRTGDQAILKPVHKAHQLLISMSNPPSALKASVFSLLGRVNVFVENYELANSYYEKADSIYSSAGMGNSFDYMQMLSGYGKSLIYVSDFRKAKQVLLQSNKLHRKAFSNPTMTIAENYKFLGWVNRDWGNFKQSNHYFLKSIELNSRLTGEESMPAALSMYHLSINYFLSADYKKAEQLAQEVLHTYQKLLEPTNDYINGAKKYVAIAKYNQNKLSEAKQLLQEIITSRTKHMGEDNFNLAGPFSHLAVVYQKQENYKKAISLLKKSIWLIRESWGNITVVLREQRLNWLQPIGRWASINRPGNIFSRSNLFTRKWFRETTINKPNFTFISPS
ncbi:protein kinase [Aliifodinibius sp. S!AR15-10]|nr:protein kinase [Aliifodinibius sp. S!AR15-10]